MKKTLFSCLICLLFSCVIAQDYQDYEPSSRASPLRVRSGSITAENRPTPVPILKQINRHNEDGSYTYGYEGADGSFKIETKIATGEVKGKYGYVDETGKVRVVEYGANKYGFQPSGDGITVAPPTLVDETTNKEGNLPVEYEDEPQPQRPFIARVSRPQVKQPPQVRPIPIAEPQYTEYEQEPEPIPQRQKFSGFSNANLRPQYAQAPAPPRVQIPGAHPSDVVYSTQQRPARPDPEYTQTQTFAVPQQQRPIFTPEPATRAGPSTRPVSEQHSQYVPRPVAQQPVAYAAPSHPQGRSTSVLDQLAKDYALPQGGAQPLHDITFGYY